MSWSATGRRTGVVAGAGGATGAVSACVADVPKRDGVCGDPSHSSRRGSLLTRRRCPADCMVTATVGVVEAVAWVVVAEAAGWGGVLRRCVGLRHDEFVIRKKYAKEKNRNRKQLASSGRRMSVCLLYASFIFRQILKTKTRKQE